MYSYIKGIITCVTATYVTLECHDIGYQIKVPNPYAFEVNQTITMYIYQHVREDALELYGFSSLNEKDMFISLISVKGLGPKGAEAILASSTPLEIVEALDSSNASFFSNFPGIGSKLSQQIILDLRGKINLNAENKTPSTKEIIDNVSVALKSLGYSNQEIKNVIRILDVNEKTELKDAVKMALKLLKKV